MKYWNKQTLYKNVDKLIEQLDLTYEDYPLDSIKLAQKFCVDLQLEKISFDKLCGILYRGKSTYIALNSNRTPEQQNFDCMHELIHYFFHNDESSFQCINPEKGIIQQNDRLEWQANEGAAQALVPYQLFIPMYVNMSIKHKCDPLDKFTLDLAKKFGVSDRIITMRIKNLEYEIYQYYFKHKKICDIQLLSHAKLQQQGLLDIQVFKHHCINCQSVLEEHMSYCPICGMKNNYWIDKKGICFMTYSGICVDKMNKASICPRCKNEHIGLGDFCPICGIYLFNVCSSNITVISPSGKFVSEHPHDPLPGNFRYCPICGEPTTFFKYGFLSTWENDKARFSQNHVIDIENDPQEQTEELELPF